MSLSAVSYRRSHLHKGADYHQEFRQNPRRHTIWKLEQRILSEILSRYFEGRRVEYLDFACGTGRILGFLESRVSTSTGVDISASMLEVARRQTTKSRIFEADITQEDVLEGELFDLITAFRFFPNAEPELRRDVIERLIEKLNPNGLLVLNNHTSTQFLWKRIVRCATLGRRGTFGATCREIRDVIEKAGLEIIETYQAGNFPESERFVFRPRWLVDSVERCCSCLPLSSLAENVVFVCRRVPHESG